MSLAETLKAARLAGKAVDIAAADFPKTEAEVVAVQAETFRIGNLSPGGWKAGPPPAGMQDTGCAQLAAEWTVAPRPSLVCKLLPRRPCRDLR